MELIDVGLYTVREASRLTEAEPREIRRWLFGYTVRSRVAVHSSPPLWTTQLAYPGEIGFRDLLELRFVKHFVSRGVHLSVVRKAIANARVMFETDYPFTAHRFLTDGRHIFHEALEQVAAEEGPLTDMASRQRVFESIVRPSLYAGIEYLQENKKKASRWYPLPHNRTVVLDPTIGFGKPILADYGIPVDTIAAAVVAERSEVRVARIFEIPRSAVSAAVKFEQRLAA